MIKYIFLLFCFASILHGKFVCEKLNTPSNQKLLHLTGNYDSCLLIKTLDFYSLKDSIFISTDKGSSWESLKNIDSYFSNGAIYTGSKVYSKNEINIFLKLKDSSKPSNNIIVRTTDRGANWQEIYLPSDFISRGYGNLDDGSEVLASKKYLLTSIDRWETFKKINIPDDIPDTCKFVPFDGLSANDIPFDNFGYQFSYFFYSAFNNKFTSSTFEYDYVFAHQRNCYYINSRNEQLVLASYRDIVDPLKEVVSIYRSEANNSILKQCKLNDTIFKYGPKLFGCKGDTIILIDFGKILYSFDGGKNWNNTNIKYDESIYPSIFFHITDQDIYFNTSYAVFKFNLTTDVKENIFINDLFISPNPATDFIEFSVEVNGRSLLQSDVKVYDVFGQTQTTPSTSLTPLQFEGEKYKIDVSGLALGMYFVRIGDKVGKFVKM